MTELAKELSALTRPSVLVRAARFGASATLRQPKPRQRLKQKPWPKLLEEEARLDSARRTGDASYSPTRHVQVLTALLCSAQPSL